MRWFLRLAFRRPCVPRQVWGSKTYVLCPTFFKAGRKKLMTSFALQERMVPKELMGDASYLDHSKLVHKYCEVEVAKEPLCERTSITGVWTGRKYERVL